MFVEAVVIGSVVSFFTLAVGVLLRKIDSIEDKITTTAKIVLEKGKGPVGGVVDAWRTPPPYPAEASWWTKVKYRFLHGWTWISWWGGWFKVGFYPVWGLVGAAVGLSLAWALWKPLYKKEAKSSRWVRMIDMFMSLFLWVSWAIGSIAIGAELMTKKAMIGANVHRLFRDLKRGTADIPGDDWDVIEDKYCNETFVGLGGHTYCKLCKSRLELEEPDNIMSKALACRTCAAVRGDGGWFVKMWNRFKDFGVVAAVIIITGAMVMVAVWLWLQWRKRGRYARLLKQVRAWITKQPAEVKGKLIAGRRQWSGRPHGVKEAKAKRWWDYYEGDSVDFTLFDDEDGYGSRKFRDDLDDNDWFNMVYAEERELMNAKYKRESDQKVFEEAVKAEALRTTTTVRIDEMKELPGGVPDPDFARLAVFDNRKSPPLQLRKEMTGDAIKIDYVVSEKGKEKTYAVLESTDGKKRVIKVTPRKRDNLVPANEPKATSQKTEAAEKPKMKQCLGCKKPMPVDVPVYQKGKKIGIRKNKYEVCRSCTEKMDKGENPLRMEAEFTESSVVAPQKPVEKQELKKESIVAGNALLNNERVMERILQVRGKDEKGNDSFKNGHILPGGVVRTTAHGPAKELVGKGQFQQGGPLGETILYSPEEETDTFVVLNGVHAVPMRHSALHYRPPCAGERVMLYAFSEKGLPYQSSGTVTTVDIGNRMANATYSSEPGMSGGTVIASSDGSCVGFHSAAGIKGENVFHPIEDLETLLIPIHLLPESEDEQGRNHSPLYPANPISVNFHKVVEEHRARAKRAGPKGKAPAELPK